MSAVSVASHTAWCDGVPRRGHATVRVDVYRRPGVRFDEAVLPNRSHRRGARYHLRAGDAPAPLSQQAQPAPGDLLVAQHRPPVDVVLPSETAVRLLLGHGVRRPLYRLVAGFLP